MRPVSLPGLSLTLGLFALVLASVGCDNSIEPYSRRSTFSIYGYLNTSTPRQVIRVKDVNEPLVGDSASPSIDATVTLEELSTGTTRTLQDSVIFFDNVATHNFWTDWTLQPDTEYRVTVRRSDGVTTQSTARTPTDTAPVAAPDSGNCLTPFTVQLPDVHSVQRVYEVKVGYLPEREYGTDGWIWVAADDFDPIRVRLSNDRVEIQFIPEPVLATTLPSIDTRPLAIYKPRCWLLNENRVRVAYVELGPGWQDRSAAQSIRLDSGSRFVQNGMGFFGALRQDTLAVTVDTANTITITPGISHN